VTRVRRGLNRGEDQSALTFGLYLSWTGVAIAVVLCAAVGVALDVLGENSRNRSRRDWNDRRPRRRGDGTDTRKLAQGIDALAEKISQVPAVILRAENAAEVG